MKIEFGKEEGRLRWDGNDLIITTPIAPTCETQLVWVFGGVLWWVNDGMWMLF
jgi:hypothetical protein